MDKIEGVTRPRGKGEDANGNNEGFKVEYQNEILYFMQNEI